jgi:hypothetical protein
MKSIKLFFILALIVYGSVIARNREMKFGPGFRPAIKIHEDARVYVRHERVYIVSEWDREERVVITRDYDLIVYGNAVPLDDRQKELVTRYYELTTEVMERTKEIAREGAQIGLQGAGIGLKAVAGVCRMILPNYDSDDLERDMERESEKIESRANILEEKGEEIDAMFDDLEILHEDMRDAIPVLQELDWF